MIPSYLYGMGGVIKEILKIEFQLRIEIKMIGKISPVQIYRSLDINVIVTEIRKADKFVKGEGFEAVSVFIRSKLRIP